MYKKPAFPALLLFICVLIFSCENEPLEGFDLVTSENQTTTGTSGTGTTGTGSGSGSGSLPSSTGTSTGDYYPRAINNEWNYTATTGSQTQIQTTKLTSSFVDSGQTVFQANGIVTSSGFTVETTSFIYKSGGDYYVYSSENQISLAGYEGEQTACLHM